MRSRWLSTSESLRPISPRTSSRAVGGHITRPLPLIGGFAADVPQNRLPMLARDPSISGVYVDGRIQMTAVGTGAWDDIEPNLAWRKSIRLSQVPAGADGTGVTVALIDTGVAQVEDLGDRVVARVDFTPDAGGDDDTDTARTWPA